MVIYDSRVGKDVILSEYVGYLYDGNLEVIFTDLDISILESGD